MNKLIALSLLASVIAAPAFAQDVVPPAAIKFGLKPGVPDKCRNSCVTSTFSPMATNKVAPSRLTNKFSAKPMGISFLGREVIMARLGT